MVQRLHADNLSVRVLTRSRSKAELTFPVRDFLGIKIAEEPEWKDCIQSSEIWCCKFGWTSHKYKIKKEIKTSRIGVMSKVRREWERTALNKNVRVALTRIGVVLGKDGGALVLQKEELVATYARVVHSLGDPSS
ncbi:Epimerase family protein SDR39U [Trema orientale]|uniref:Epimerase family protein SDR39U n=1 Tax=Trema orientale TaxID=63057 RepID=A0A2P5FQ42_TREOI|nr:Epimerase family protein SDR39U [Trema orientale]